MDTTTTVAVDVMPKAVETSVSFIVQQLNTVMGIIVQNPVLCLGIAIWVAGAGIGLFKRLV